MSGKDVRPNLKQVFNYTDSESIGRCIDYVDFTKKKQIDQLLVMTFVYQIRDHFESKKLKKDSQEINNNMSSAKSVVSNAEKLNPFDSDDEIDSTINTVNTTILAQGLDLTKNFENNTPVKTKMPQNKTRESPKKDVILHFFFEIILFLKHHLGIKHNVLKFGKPLSKKS